MFDELAVHVGDVVESLQAAPDGLRSGLTLGGDAAAELRDQTHGLIERGLVVLAGLGAFTGAYQQRLPLVRLEVGAGRTLGSLARLLGQPDYPPGDDQIDGKTRLQAVGATELAVLELAVLEPAAAFEGAVVDLDLPACCVPLQALAGRLGGLGGHAGNKRPAQRFHARRGRVCSSAVPASHGRSAPPCGRCVPPDYPGAGYGAQARRSRAGRRGAP